MIREGTLLDVLNTPASGQGGRPKHVGTTQPIMLSRMRSIPELAANPRTFIVAEADAVGDLAGMLNLSIFEWMPKPGKLASVWVYLSNAYVLPAHRNAGVGTELVSAAIRHARLLGAARIVTSPSPASKSFYARNGFEPSDELAIYRPVLARINATTAAGSDSQEGASTTARRPLGSPRLRLLQAGQMLLALGWRQYLWLSACPVRLFHPREGNGAGVSF